MSTSTATLSVPAPGRTAAPSSPLLAALADAPAGLTVKALVAVVGGWHFATFRELMELERAGLVRRAGRGTAERWTLQAAEGEA